MRNPSAFLRRNSDIQIQGSFIILFFHTTEFIFSVGDLLYHPFFFYIHSQGRAYLFYTSFTYIMSLSLRANFKITWISELLLCSWENTVLPTEKEGILLLRLSRQCDDQGNCPGSVLTGIGWDLDKTQGALGGATGLRKYLPSPMQSSGSSDYVSSSLLNYLKGFKIRSIKHRDHNSSLHTSVAQSSKWFAYSTPELKNTKD